jgi:hypothetical protein
MIGVLYGTGILCSGGLAAVVGLAMRGQGTGFGAIGIVILGLFLGFLLGVLVGIFVVKAYLHYKGSVLYGLSGGIICLLLVIVVIFLAEPLQLDQNGLSLWAAFILILLSPIATTIGFHMRRPRMSL